MPAATPLMPALENGTDRFSAVVNILLVIHDFFTFMFPTTLYTIEERDNLLSVAANLEELELTASGL